MKTPALLLVFAGVLSAAEPASIPEAFAQGKVSLNARLRYEQAAQTGLRDAEAFTLRTRLGYTTAQFHGWKGMVEAENIIAADGDSYSQAGLNAGGAGRTVIADPTATEINQAWIAWQEGNTTATLGRQRLVLDNARFIGDVGWRQNQQTFDAFALQDKTLDDTTLTYAYLDQVNRVFSDRHAQGRWRSDSHLFHVSYAGYPAGTITAYAYLLDFDNSAVNSCATYGLSFAGTRPVRQGIKFAYRAEAATQSDFRSSALDYQTSYFDLEAGLAAKSGSLTAGYEVLGSDRNVGFKTPLATLHAFNGWADLFLATPAAGLRDTFIKATATIPGDVALVGFYHWYESDRGRTDLGTEFNAQVSHKFGKFVTALVKYADFRRDSPANPDVRKLWLQVEFVY